MAIKHYCLKFLVFICLAAYQNLALAARCGSLFDLNLDTQDLVLSEKTRPSTKLDSFSSMKMDEYIKKHPELTSKLGEINAFIERTDKILSSERSESLAVEIIKILQNDLIQLLIKNGGSYRSWVNLNYMISAYDYMLEPSDSKNVFSRDNTTKQAVLKRLFENKNFHFALIGIGKSLSKIRNDNWRLHLDYYLNLLSPYLKDTPDVFAMEILEATIPIFTRTASKYKAKPNSTTNQPKIKVDYQAIKDEIKNISLASNSLLNSNLGLKIRESLNRFNVTGDQAQKIVMILTMHPHDDTFTLLENLFSKNWFANKNETSKLTILLALNYCLHVADLADTTIEKSLLLKNTINALSKGNIQIDVKELPSGTGAQYHYGVITINPMVHNLPYFDLSHTALVALPHEVNHFLRALTVRSLDSTQRFLSEYSAHQAGFLGENGRLQTKHEAAELALRLLGILTNGGYPMIKQSWQQYPGQYFPYLKSLGFKYPEQLVGISPYEAKRKLLTEVPNDEIEPYWGWPGAVYNEFPN